MNYNKIIILIFLLTIIINDGKLANGYCFQVTNGVPSYSEGPNCFQISNGGSDFRYRPKFHHYGGNNQFGTLPKGGEGFWQNFPFSGQQFVYSGYSQSNGKNGKGWASTQCSVSCIGTMCSHSCN
ncbi:hypothetical protein ACQ4LE_005882 [Meloidogyne hapla]